MHWPTTWIHDRSEDHRGRDKRTRAGEPHPQGSHHPARAPPYCRRSGVSHAPTCYRLVLCVPHGALDHLPRVVHRDGNYVYHRVRRRPCPCPRGEAQAQGSAHRQCYGQFWERRVDRASQHALHLGGYDFACRTRVLLLWIWKVRCLPYALSHDWEANLPVEVTR
jgi:hypothetical protein